MKNICHTSGSEGSCRILAEQARKHGHKIVQFTFQGSCWRIPRDEVRILSQETLIKVDPLIELVNVNLKLMWPGETQYRNDIIRRDAYIVNECESLYAIDIVNKNGKISKETTWAVHLFLILHKDSPNCWVYDQINKIWLNWQEGHWVPGIPPKPKGTWAAAGTTQMIVLGHHAIQSLFTGKSVRRSSYHFRKPSPTPPDNLP